MGKKLLEARPSERQGKMEKEPQSMVCGTLSWVAPHDESGAACFRACGFWCGEVVSSIHSGDH